MERITIAEVEKIDDGMPISRMVTGVIGFIAKQKVSTFTPKGENQPITKKSQGIAIKDDSGSIWVEIDDHAEILRESQGKVIIISGWKNDKNEWKGIKKTSYEDEDENKNKITKHKIHVTKTGNIKVEGVKEEPKKEEPQKIESSGQKKESSSSGTGQDTKVKTEKELEREHWLQKNLIDNRSMLTIAIVKEVLEGNTAKGKIVLSDIPALVEASIMLIYGKDGDEKIINAFKSLDEIPFTVEDNEGK